MTDHTYYMPYATALRLSISTSHVLLQHNCHTQCCPSHSIKLLLCNKRCLQTHDICLTHQPPKDPGMTSKYMLPTVKARTAMHQLPAHNCRAQQRSSLLQNTFLLTKQLHIIYCLVTDRLQTPCMCLACLPWRSLTSLHDAP